MTTGAVLPKGGDFRADRQPAEHHRTTALAVLGPHRIPGVDGLLAARGLTWDTPDSPAAGSSRGGHIFYRGVGNGHA
ncbi:hypothetical protein BH23GEM9_BH23GEM9_25220 [soil metagenome]